MLIYLTKIFILLTLEKSLCESRDELRERELWELRELLCDLRDPFDLDSVLGAKFGGKAALTLRDELFGKLELRELCGLRDI